MTTTTSTSRTSRVAISGNTYPVKDQLKALGGRWDATSKVWMVPADRANEARQLVAGAPHNASHSHASTGGGRTWDPSRFSGQGRSCGGYRKACVSDGNCSSFGSGRSCGGWDCDGY